MNTIFRNYKPFEYKVYNNKAELEDYSGGFLTKEDANTWYNTHGVWLEKTFKRTLVLVDNSNQMIFNF